MHSTFILFFIFFFAWAPKMTLRWAVLCKLQCTTLFKKHSQHAPLFSSDIATITTSSHTCIFFIVDICKLYLEHWNVDAVCFSYFFFEGRLIVADEIARSDEQCCLLLAALEFVWKCVLTLALTSWPSLYTWSWQLFHVSATVMCI